MNGEDRPLRHPSVETADFETEAVLYDERSGTVHHLNASACAVWRLLDGRPVGEIVVLLSDRTGIPQSDIGGDVAQAIAELRTAGLLAD
jgi:PqqD family protein of HPr-rel-A system